MFKWLKNLFKKESEVEYEDRWWESKEIDPVTRVGNGPEQKIGGEPGLGYGGTAGDTDVGTVDPIVTGIRETSAAELVITDEPIVWAPVDNTVVFTLKKERKPKKLNKGLTEKAKKAKSKAKSKKKV
jgi:hypothetical protein